MRDDEVYLLSLAVECGLHLAKLVLRKSEDVNMSDCDDDDEDDAAAKIPVLTLSNVSALLAPLLRQTVLARFPAVASAPNGSRQPRISGNGDNSENFTTNSSSSSPLSSSPMRLLPTNADWAHVYESEAPAVCAWWSAIVRRLPTDADFATADGACNAGADGGIFSVPGARRQIDGLLQSAEAMSAQAFNLRFSVVHECRRAAQLSGTLCGMDLLG
jgi:hypothetical protein